MGPLRRHPWAIGLMESRANPGPVTLRHHDATLVTLRSAGFSVAMTAQQFAGEYPHLVEMATEHILRPGYDFGDEFEIGLSVILDALTRSIREPGATAWR